MQSKYRQHLGETFGCLVCLLLVGYPPFLFTSPSFSCCVGWFSLLDLSGQFPAVPVVPDSLYAVSGGFPRASNKKLLR